MSETITLSMAEAEELVEAAFVAQGVPAGAARSVALALVAAEAEGQVGHGFSRISDYVAQARSGKVIAEATPLCHEVGATSLIVDAGHGFAYPAIDLALDRVMAAAQTHGCACVSIIKSHHCGALSMQVEKMAQAGFVGLMVANAPAAIAPWGGKRAVFGTNPIAFAAPRVGEDPLVMDLALSRVARGKVMNAKKMNKPIPEGWALDADGNPTTDPEAALAGTMVSIGEAKGTALLLMVEVLAAVLGGAKMSAELSSYFTADGPPPASGQFILAMKPGDAGAFAARLEALLQEIATSDGGRLPGSRRLAARATALEQGIKVQAAYVEGARVLAGWA